MAIIIEATINDECNLNAFNMLSEFNCMCDSIWKRLPISRMAIGLYCANMLKCLPVFTSDDATTFKQCVQQLQSNQLWCLFRLCCHHLIGCQHLHSRCAVVIAIVVAVVVVVLVFVVMVVVGIVLEVILVKKSQQ